jgi:hypothetical protein
MVSPITRFLLLAGCWPLACTAVAQSGSALPVSSPQSVRSSILSKGPLRSISAGQLGATSSASAARTTSVSEAWRATYNGPNFPVNEALDVAVDGAGNVYVTGSSFVRGSQFTAGQYDYATVKYSPNGQQLWVARYNGPANGNDQATDLAVDAAGNVYVTGYSVGSSSGQDYATVKYSSSGQQVWVERYNGPINTSDYARSLALDAAGNAYVTGYSMSGGNGSQNYVTVKYDGSTGQQQWVATYDGAGRNDVPVEVAVDASGNAYVTGYSVGSSAAADYATVKYSPSGQQLWAARYNGPADINDLASALAVDAAGNAYVTGYSATTVNNASSQDYATVKYSASGQQEWVATYNGPGNELDQATDVAVDATGNVYVTGSSMSARNPLFNAHTGLDYATLKYSPSGQQLWVARYNGRQFADDNARKLALDTTGNVYVTGTTIDNTNTTNYATVKYTSSGQPEWEAYYDGPSSRSEDTPAGIVVDATGNVYVTGSSLLNNTTTDYLTVKYTQSSSAPLTLTTTVTNAGCGTGGAIDLTVSGGVAPYRYSWTGPNGFSANTEDISGLLAGTYSVTVTDAAQNSVTQQATVSAGTLDTTPPVVRAAGFVVALNSNGTRTIEAADVDGGSTDACSGIASLRISPSTFTCANVGPNQVTLTVIDNAGNSSSETVTVVVVDNTAPVVLAAGFQVSLTNGTRTIEAADVDGGSYDACGSVVSLSISPSTFTCANVGPNQVTLTVRDNSGNVATQTVTVIVVADATCTSSIASRNNSSGANLSNESQLHAYPNPVTDQATVSFRPTQTGMAQVKVYNQLGVLVATLYDGQVEASRLYSATLNGQPLAAGVYTCQLITNGKVVNKRLLVSK